jgi:MFS family permease
MTSNFWALSVSGALHGLAGGLVFLTVAIVMLTDRLAPRRSRRILAAGAVVLSVGSVFAPLIAHDVRDARATLHAH